jgi:hypothetical protein
MLAIRITGTKLKHTVKIAVTDLNIAHRAQRPRLRGGSTLRSRYFRCAIMVDATRLNPAAQTKEDDHG